MLSEGNGGLLLLVGMGGSQRGLLQTLYAALNFQQAKRR